MDGVRSVIIILLALIFIIGIPILISYLLYRLLRNKKIHKAFKLIALIPVFLIGYFIYDGMYPSDEFYEEDYLEVTKLKLPETGKIIAKSASFPDHFGDYTSAALIELDEKEYHRLLNHLTEIGFVNSSNTFSSSEISYVKKRLNGKKYIRQLEKQEEHGKYFFVGFLSDKKSIVYHRVSW